MTALITRIGEDVDGIDFFCGGGGSTGGIVKAGVTMRVAANHNEHAIQTHAANFPDIEHVRADLMDQDSADYMDPENFPPARFVWASPSCFPAGTLILTKRGLVPIEDVVVGEEVWTHRQRWRPVTAAWEEVGDTVTVAGLGNSALETTANHGIWSRSTITPHVEREPDPSFPHDCDFCGQPTRASRRGIGRALRYCSKACSQRHRDLRNGRELTDPRWVEAADLEGHWWSTPQGISGVELPVFHPSVDWWWLGRWVGDGWVSGSDVVICCGSHEADQLGDHLGEGWRRSRVRTGEKFTFYDSGLVRWLTEHFGKGAANKQLPTWMLALPGCDQRLFLDGYVSADGHRERRGEAVQVQVSSVSKALAHGVRLLAVNLGQAATVAPVKVAPTVVTEGRTVSQRPSWVVAWWEDTTKKSKARWLDDGKMWSRVRTVSPARRQVRVFNLTVEDDHSYVADGVVVRNCRFHSQANARKLYERGPQGLLFEVEEFDHEAYANSERSRISMVCPLRYAAKHHPELVVVENVCEVARWGPARDGSTFRWWLNEWVKLGYEYKVCFFNSMFFPPCPQSRDRLYVAFWRKGNRAPNLDYRPKALCTSDRCGGTVVEAVQTWKPRKSTWPLERWGKYGAQYTYTCPNCRREVFPVAWPAYSAIDWSDLGPTLAEREDRNMRPLAPATMERIRRCVTKFRNGPAVLIPAKAVWGTDKPVTVPMATQTSQQDKALVNGGVVTKSAVLAMRTHARPVDPVDSIPTVVAGNVGMSLVSGGAVLPAAGNTSERPRQTRGRSIADALYTQTATMEFGFAHMPAHTVFRGTDPSQIAASAHAVSEAMLTISAGGGHHGVVSPALLQKINGGPGDTSWHSVYERMNTITGRDTHGLIVLPWLEQWRSDPAAITEQLATVMTHARHSLVSMEADLVPVTDEELLQIRFRMLKPTPELRRGMAFDDEYILLGSQEQQTSLLGNAVTPPVASWITERCLETLRGERQAA